MELRLNEAHRVLAGATSYVQDTTDIMDELLHVQVGPTAQNIFINDLLPIPERTKDNVRAVRSAERRQDELREVLLRSDNLNDVRNTGWGFVNGVAEWNEWTGSHVRRRRLNPMERLLNDAQQSVVHQARDMVLA